MAEGDFWISAVLNDSSRVVGTDIDRSEPAWQAIRRGEVPAAEELPIRIYAMYRNQKFPKKMPELFEGGGGTKISPRLAAIFRRFNIGSTWICPAELYRHDRVTRVDRDFSIMAGWDKPNFLVEEESRGLKGRVVTRHRPNPPPPDVWRMPLDMKDGDIAIAPRQLDGLDLWYDPKLCGGLFFSDRLKAALCEGGYARLFKFRKCRVLPLH